LDRVGKGEIVPSLMHSARLLEKVFLDRSRGRSFGELDEDLFSQASVGATAATAAAGKVNGADLTDGVNGTGSAIASEVPDDRVQEWLTNTFTRRGSVVATAGRRRRLRSLAAVVRTSVYFERLFRGGRAGAAGGDATAPQPPPVPIGAPALAYLEAGAHRWDFDPFGLADLTGDRPVRNMGLYLFHKFDLIDKFGMQMETLEAFLDLVESGYKRHGNPYHNCTHSADVAQSCCYIVAHHGLADWLSDVELLALVFAALVHDYEHTGTTNNYHVQTRSHLALVYNDRSVLESHHVSAVFRRMQEAKCNPLKGLAQPEYRQFRSLVIDMVLATDMSTHFAQVSAMKDAIPCPENLPRVDILAYVLHVADISHPAKSWSLHQRWTSQLNEEFFAQGDREKQLGLPCSPLCDREKTMVASSQVGENCRILLLTYLLLTGGAGAANRPRGPYRNPKVRSGGIGDPHPAGVPDEGAEVSDIVRG
uniref:Phosphodiesterase n=1 Tax=Macrostomum lignano TaxID=282301 RepID=A0A1I8FXM7_9PLAT